jgi:benzil reductase ((S)-benzoin forming)
MSTLVCVTGASSGIGRAVAESVPLQSATLMTVSRRPSPVGEWIEADLSDPASWPRVGGRIASALTARAYDRAILLHFAGLGSPHASTLEADLGEYTASVLLNAAAGPVLGKAFVSACRDARVPAIVVLCSSPGAATPMPGMSHYGAGKLAMEYWVRAVTAENDSDDVVRAFAVVPFAVDTPMVRDVIERPTAGQPAAGVLREAAARGELASAESTAAEIWRLVVDGAAPGAVLAVGAVPPEMRGAA